MRRLTTGFCAISTLILLFASPLAAARRQRAQESVIAVQPTESSTQLVLLSRPGWGRVESARGRRAVDLDAEERLSVIAETASGWVAGGVGQDGENSSVFFIAERSGLLDRLPSVPRREALQLMPVLLVLDGDLRGAAWLEGKSHRSLAVRYTEWTGIDWGPVATVSSPGRGSQTGLAGLALRNGELLLAWSRFDGSDDELYWSWREGSAWSRPARVGGNNRTPDITPALARSGRGATLVWARMDEGEYQLLSRGFTSGNWQPERVVSGPGSLFPSLVRQDDRLLVLYRTAMPQGWSLAELDGRTHLPRRAHVEETSSLRPIVTEQGATGSVLRWRQMNRSAVLRWDVQR